jgi:hypothetical protein
MTDEQVVDMRTSPTWLARLATATTIVREARIENAWVVAPGQFEDITAPTLFLVGSESPPDIIEITRRCDPFHCARGYARRPWSLRVQDASRRGRQCDTPIRPRLALR